MQEVAQLYTSMPRDVSSWCMPISWQVPQEGNNVNNFIGMILLFNWTHGCHILFLVLNLEYYLKTLPLELAFVYLIYLVNSFSCKVFVRCKCQTLKKKWFCQDVQAAHRNAGSDPTDIPKNQYGIGLLPCNFIVLVLQFFILKSAHLIFLFFACLSLEQIQNKTI